MAGSGAAWFGSVARGRSILKEWLPNDTVAIAISRGHQGPLTTRWAAGFVL
jgi:hypothetical protein